MPEPQFALLRRRLLDGGIAPRRARRLMHELRAHFADLLAGQLQAGLAGPAAAQAALQRLGDQEALARQMLARPELLSWSRRWPWAIYALAPLPLFPAMFSLLLATTVGIGWVTQKLQLASPADFLSLMRAIRLFALYVLPVMLAAAMATLAGRRSVAPGWGLLSIALLALWGATTNMTVLPHLIGAGVGMSLHPRVLAPLLLYRWLPTVVAATAVSTISLRLLRAREHDSQVTENGTDATC
ncbi:MAG TPA: hypothetical protein VHX52_08340 [Steroidobacteraceae bacterium]|jgi:hypothetical protein|nr:hypothetical protein [Steroidobacteraceae bacterium]